MKKFLCAVLVLLLAFSFVSCGSDKEQKVMEVASVNVYSLNTARTTISRMIISDFLDGNLYTTSCKATMRQNPDVFDEGLELQKIEIENNTAKFHFNSLIEGVEDTERMYMGELLALCVGQYEDITKIQFMTEGKPVNGFLSQPYYSRLVYYKDEMNVQVDVATLYYSNNNADGLIREKRLICVDYGLAPSIASELFSGTADYENKVNVIPENTVLTGIQQEGNLLTIDVSASFMNNEYYDMLSIYSVVNTLTEIEGVDYVKITVNGSSEAVLGNFSLGDAFSRREDLILY